ncbi:IclR family transcriptional regulator [Tamaricihabitans halophyticus]|uniref:IclR family transcriptional regulator n=1 Tax=Tamaricihabitans halophyticus TaxID=1262583 RepID=A0A4R2Q894_9PSEU|nr:IclR family transcriptional regulator [Tamaricihabitans halophyticus]TCP44749.1 IclR family transcriptional regulator [Tamaricihabitans halophyticus]
MSQSLERGLAVLAQLAQSGRPGDGKTLDELAAELGVHKSTVSRLLRTLEAGHFVRRVNTRHYVLGSALFELANQSLDELDVRRVAQPVLVDLNRRTGHTVHLASLEAHEAVCIDKVDGRHSVRMYSRIGRRAPVHCTAVGKVLVAGQPAELRAAIAAELSYSRKTGTTITDAGAFAAELSRVAERGYAVDNAEHEDFIHCVAAPVRRGDGMVVAAISLSVPGVLLDLDGLLALVPELLAAAEEASARSGWTEKKTNR